MKKGLVVILLFAVFLAGGFWALQGAVNRRLAQALPEAGRATGVPMQASELGLSLWRGALDVGNLRVGNPPGFSESNLLTLAQGHVSLRYLPLFRRCVRFDDVMVRDADLTIIRSSDGRVNVKRSDRAGGEGKVESGPGQKPSDGSGETGATPPPKKWPHVAVDRLRANLCVRFVDHASEAGDTLLRLQVSSTGLATYGDSADESAWGTLSAEGRVEARGREAPLRLTARIAPVGNLQAPTFKMNATITGLDDEMVRSLLGGKNVGVRGEAERVEIELFCEEGRFDESRSRLQVTLKHVKMGGRTAPRLTLTIPVHGTVEKPKLRLEQALFGAMAQLLAAPPEERGPGSAETPKQHKKNADLGEALSKGLESLLKANP